VTVRDLAEEFIRRCNAGFESEFHHANWWKKHRAEIEALPTPLRRDVTVAFENAGPIEVSR
jgi:hypothetical protein